MENILERGRVGIRKCRWTDNKTEDPDKLLWTELVKMCTFLNQFDQSQLCWHSSKVGNCFSCSKFSYCYHCNSQNPETNWQAAPGVSLETRLTSVRLSDTTSLNTMHVIPRVCCDTLNKTSQSI